MAQRTGNPGTLPPAADVPRVDPGPVQDLRGDLAGYTVDAVEALVGGVASAALAREEPLPAVLAVRPLVEREPLAALVAAFVLGLPVSRAALDAALPALGTEGAARLGLVQAAGSGPCDAVRPLVDLRPYQAGDALGTADWWVASDLGEAAVHGPLRPDHVLGVGGASVTLARCTVRSPVGAALDLGTGCGIQALHLLRHARSVTATDLSRRALAFAAFTLALNGQGPDGTALRGSLQGSDGAPGPDGGTAGVHLRQGSLLEPVAGRQFDLVVSNPPFVITPRVAGVPAYEYRDGGMVGDDLVRTRVTGVGGVLAPGGVAQFLGNWEHRRGEPWQERVGAWLEESGLDGWIVQREVQDPAEYAQMWIRDAGDPAPDRRAGLFAAWLADFAERRVEAVGFGIVTLRRPPEGNDGVRLRRLEDLRGPLDRPLGEHLAAALAAHDLSARHDDAALLGRRLLVAPDVTEERHHRPGEDDPVVVLLRQGGGFGRSVRAGTALAGFVGACDGELTAGQIVAALATLLGVETAELLAELVPAVRGLLVDGFLTLAAPRTR